MPDLLRSRLSLALEAGDLGVWVLDTAADTAEWTDRMGALHGVEDAEVVDGVRAGAPRDVFRHVHAGDRDDLDQVLRAVRTTADVVVATYRVRVPGAGMRWVTARFASVQDDAGVKLVVAVTIDVTERKRAELESNRRRAVVESMHWVHQAIISGQGLDEITAGIARAATGVLGAQCGVVIHPVPGETDDTLGWVFCGVDDVDREPPSNLSLPASMTTGDDIRVIADLASPGDLAALLVQLDLPEPMGSMGSAIVAPVGRAEDATRGVMIFTHPDRGYFTTGDARLATSIAASASMAIQNAQRHEQQRLAARTFQRQLLPVVAPTVHGMDVCVRYHPGRDGLDVGGDWYDVIELDDHRVGLVVGDVCGHGLAAAADMGQFRYSFRAGVQTSSVEQAFSLLNTMALREMRTTATLAYVEVDTRTGSCAGWSCGHLPPVIAPADGGAVRWLGSLETGGPMLGFLPEVTVTPIRTTLGPGETLLLYTDGLVERRGEAIDDGLDRLAASFADRSPALEALCDELYTVLADMGPDADDTALLAVRRPIV